MDMVILCNSLIGGNDKQSVATDPIKVGSDTVQGSVGPRYTNKRTPLDCIHTSFT